MNIDWNKAPEGATHWDTGLHGRTPGWMRLDGTTWYWWPVDGAKCERKWFVCCETYPSETKEFVARPAAWAGEGLPPVGTVCEFAGFNPEETLPTDPRVGDQVTVIAHFMSGSFEVAAFTFYAPPEFEYLQVSQGAYGCFRPIRTPEQIAADDREKGIREMLSVCPYPGSHEDVARVYAEALYDSGYRKQVAP